MVLKCECVQDTFLRYDYTNPSMQIYVENAPFVDNPTQFPWDYDSEEMQTSIFPAMDIK